MTIDYNPLKNSQVHTDINIQNTTKPKKRQGEVFLNTEYN